MDSAGQQRAAEAERRAVEEQQRLDSAVQQALAQQQAAAPQAAAPQAAVGGAERVALLQQLAELKSQGILTEEEFAAEKARILGS